MAGTAEFQSLIGDPEPQAVARRELCISYFFTTLHASRNSSPHPGNQKHQEQQAHITSYNIALIDDGLTGE